MSIEVKLPELGDGIESGDVLEVFVRAGETVEREQGLLELETDKATVTVPSPAAGKIVRILVEPGQTVPVGSVIAELESNTGAAAVATPEPPAAKPAPPTEKPVSSEAPARHSEPEPVQTAPSKPAQTQPSVQAVARDQTIASEPSRATTSAAVGPVAAGPAVRRFAREVGVDITQVVGTGEGGRITREDVLAAVRAASSSRPNAVAESTAIVTTTRTTTNSVGDRQVLTLPGAPGQDDYGPVRVEKLSKIRKTIANQMHKSWSSVPRVTNFDDADVTDLETLRQTSRDDYAAQGIKLTTMPFLIKAVATALRHHPTINATLDLEGEQISYRDYVNMGIAVDTDRGLVVPNIRNVDSLSIPDIAKALAQLSARIRNGDFGVNELRGGTFTISNLGAIGGTYSTPIINVPEVAILLVGRTRKLPVVMVDDSIQARQMMPLSLSYDHRLVDGGTAARFLNDVIAYLEAPSRLLLAIN